MVIKDIIDLSKFGIDGYYIRKCCNDILGYDFYTADVRNDKLIIECEYGDEFHVFELEECPYCDKPVQLFKLVQPDEKTNSRCVAEFNRK